MNRRLPREDHNNNNNNYNTYNTKNTTGSQRHDVPIRPLTAHIHDDECAPRKRQSLTHTHTHTHTHTYRTPYKYTTTKALRAK